MSASRSYERNTCFYLWVYKDEMEPEMVPFPIAKTLILPISNKEYKTTLKNIKTYIDELLKQDLSIMKIEIERATHVGSFERSSDTTI